MAKQMYPKLVTAILAVCIVGLYPVKSKLFADGTSWIWVETKNANAKASSTLIEKGKPASFYAPQNAIDGWTKTAWCAGAGKAIGESIEVRFPPTPVTYVSVLPGYGRTVDLYLANNRIKEYELTLFERSGRTQTQRGTFSSSVEVCDDGKRSIENLCKAEVYDEKSPAYATCLRRLRKTEMCKTDPGGPLGVLVRLDKMNCLTGFRLKILSVYPGARYKDTCIAEMAVLNDLYPSKDQLATREKLCK